MKFKLNEAVVYVKLTAAGAAYCGAHINEIGVIKEVGDGWSKWHLWVLMSFFGELLGSGCPKPFDDDIILEHDGSPEREPGNVKSLAETMAAIDAEIDP